MEHPITISSKGKVFKKDWVYRTHKLFSGGIHKTKYLMDKQTWDDIMKWQVEESK